MKDAREKAAKKHKCWLHDNSIRIDVQSRHQPGFDGGMKISSKSSKPLARYSTCFAFDSKGNQQFGNIDLWWSNVRTTRCCPKIRCRIVSV